MALARIVLDVRVYVGPLERLGKLLGRVVGNAAAIYRRGPAKGQKRARI